MHCTTALHSPFTLSAESGCACLQFRFLTLTANFHASTAQFPQIPTFSSFLDPHNSLVLSLECHQRKSLKLKSLPTILLYPHPWLSSSPPIWLDLADPQNFLPSNSAWQTSPNRNPNLASYTIQGTVTPHRLRNSAFILTAEVQPIYSWGSYLTLLTANSSFQVISYHNSYSCKALIHLIL